jgi:hypothetical protein
VLQFGLTGGGGYGLVNFPTSFSVVCYGVALSAIANVAATVAITGHAHTMSTTGFQCQKRAAINGGTVAASGENLFYIAWGV